MTTSAQRSIAFSIAGPIRRRDLPGLGDRICAMLRADRPDVALCDVAGVEPDAVTVEALLRLQLAARRHGCRVVLRRASPRLLALVAFLGLADVLPEQTQLRRAGAAAGRSAETGSPHRGRT